MIIKFNDSDQYRFLKRFYANLMDHHDPVIYK